MKRCLHCRRRPANKCRGLCTSCYYRPGVRDLYPTLSSKFNTRGVGVGVKGRRPLPKRPTKARPGTAEKVAVLRERAAAGEQLFHPRDQDWTLREETAAGARPGRTKRGPRVEGAFRVGDRVTLSGDALADGLAGGKAATGVVVAVSRYGTVYVRRDGCRAVRRYDPACWRKLEG